MAGHDKAAPIQSNVMPGGWVVLGPFKTDANQADFLAASGGGKVFPKAGMETKIAGETLKWEPVPDANYWTDQNFSRGFRTIDISAVFKRQFHTSGYFFTVVDVDADRFVRFEPHLPGMRWKDFGNTLKGMTWVDGKQFEGKDLMLLKKGRHCIMVQASMGELPNAWGRVWVVPRFVDAADEVAAARKKYEQDIATWQDHTKTKNALFVLGEK